MDTLNFIEILKTMPDIRYLRTEKYNNSTFEVYESDNSRINPTIIDITDDTIPEFVIRGYLNLLGIPELIPSFYPPKTEEEEKWDVIEELAKVQQKDNDDKS